MFRCLLYFPYSEEKDMEYGVSVYCLICQQKAAAYQKYSINQFPPKRSKCGYA